MNRKALVGISIAMALGAGTGAYANPVDGNVVAGGATITTSGNNLNINQTTNRAVIDWRSFDIAPNESTNFIQPDANSVALNRVTNGAASHIQGNLTANGKVILVNQSGILFDAGSKVDVGGLVATTGDIDNNAFMNGGMQFNKPGQANAEIVNAGTITVKDAGLVGLAAPTVKNSGVINAKLGKVQLVSGDEFTLDLYGDGLVELGLGDNSTQQKIENTGTINAEGGDVLITASQAKNVVNSLISISGEINAPTYEEHNGRIIISNARATTDTQITSSTPVRKVEVKGKLNASGKAQDQSGGKVEIYADDILLGSGSLIDVSGFNGGGTVLVGGDYQGTGSNTTALRNVMESGALINANALNSSDGGKVILWSGDQTWFEGAITAKGGSVGGNGGLVETSGEKYLEFNGSVNTSAQNGSDGTLLLDPTDLEITNSQPDTNIATSGTTTVTYQPSVADTTTYLTATTIQNQLANNNVIVQTKSTGSGQGNLTVNAPITWASTKTLTLTAANLLTINSAITLNAASSLTLQSSDIAINAPISGNASSTIALQYSTNSAMNMSFGDSTLYTYSLSSAELNNILSWGTVTFGTSSSTGNFDLGQMTWNLYPHFRTTGTLTVSGTQTASSHMDLAVGALNINAAMSSTGAGTLTIRGGADNATIGLGTGSTGTIQIDDTEFANINGGWGKITLGSTSSGYRVIGIDVYSSNLTQFSVLNNLQFIPYSTSGAGLTVRTPINTNSNSLAIIGRKVDISADLSGTGTLTFYPDASSTIGLGTGAGGTLQLDDSELAHIKSGWGSIVFGDTSNTSSIKINTAQTWNAPVTFTVVDSATNGLTISSSADQNFGANSVTINASVINIGSNLTGTGDLTIAPTASRSVGIGGTTGASGAVFELDNTEIGYFNNSNWNSISLGFGGDTAATTVIGTTTWANNLTIFGGAGGLSITGAQTMVSGKSLTLRTSSLDIQADLNGSSTGSLTIYTYGSSADTFGLGDSAGGTLQLDNAELDHIKDGWGNLIFGYSGTATNHNLVANAYTWKDNVELRAGAGTVTINGIQTLNANNLTLTSNSLVMSAAVNGSGILTAQPYSSSSIVLGGTGTASATFLNSTELGFIDTGSWSKIILGSNTASSSGAMTVNAHTWGSDLELRANTGTIAFGSSQVTDVGAHNLTIRTAGNITINSNNTVSGTGTFYIIPYNNATIGIGGTAPTGAINITSSEVGRITDGWSTIIIGDQNSSGAIDVENSTWKDNLTFLVGTGGITFASGNTVSMGTTNVGVLTIQSDLDFSLLSSITGAGNINITPYTNSISYGLGDGSTGTITFSSAELANLTGNTYINIGSTTLTGAIDAEAVTWNSGVKFQTLSGAVNINGTQTVTANRAFAIYSDNIHINAPINSVGSTNSSANIGIGTQTATTMGVGTGSTGAVVIDDTELGYISNNGWYYMAFGGTTASPFAPTVANIDVYSSNLTSLNFTMTNGTSNGAVAYGALYLLSSNNVSVRTPINVSGSILFVTGDLNLAADLNGNGTLQFSPETHSEILGVGDGAGGNFQVDDAELDHIKNGWSTINFGSTGQSTVETIFNTARTWNSNVVAYGQNNELTVIKAPQNFGTHNFSIEAHSVDIEADLIGTGTLTIESSVATGTPDASIAIGGATGASGADIEIDDTELTHILGKGWSNYIIGIGYDSLPLTINHAINWNAGLTLATKGLITINGVQTLGANNLEIDTDITPVINDGITGSGALTLANASATTLSVYENTGTFVVDDSLFAKIGTAWSSYTFGRTGFTSTVNVGVHTWDRDITFKGSNIININGAQDMGSHNLTIYSKINNINAALTGSNTLTFIPVSVSSGTIGTTSGSIYLNQGSVANITDGWSNIIIGNSSTTAAFNINALTWNDNVSFTSTGVITVVGAQNVGANNLTFATSSDIAINADLIGTGTFTLDPLNNVSLGLNSSTGSTIQLGNGEVAHLIDGWSDLIFGDTSYTGNITIRSNATLSDDVTLITNGNIEFGATWILGANNLTMVTSGDIIVDSGYQLKGTGALSITPINNASIGIGDSAAGDINISTVSLGRIVSWSNVLIGNSTTTGDIELNDGVFHFNPFLETAGTINITGPATFGNYDLTLITDHLNYTGVPTGTSTSVLKIQPLTLTSMGVGTGSIGAFNISDAEYNNIVAGNWGTVTFALPSINGDGTLDVYSSNLTSMNFNSLVLSAYSGLLQIRTPINISKINLALHAADMNILADLTYVGDYSASASAGYMQIATDFSGAVIGLGDGAGGTLQLDDAELDHINPGWRPIQLGSDTYGTNGVIFNTARTWTSDLYLKGTNIEVVVNAPQDFGSHNVTIKAESLDLNADITGTGSLVIQPFSSGSIGIGDNTGADLEISDEDISHLNNGWDNITFGNSANNNPIIINSSVTWDSNINYAGGSGGLTFGGNLDFGNNDFTINTDTDIVLTGTLSGHGNLYINPLNNATIGIGDGSTGVVNLSTAELAKILDGWNSITFGNSTTSGAIDVQAANWNDSVKFITGTGMITFNGAQNFNNNNLTIISGVTPVNNSTITGTGAFSFSTPTGTSLGVADGAGAVQISNAFLDSIGTGWSSYSFGSSDNTADVTIGPRNWNAPLYAYNGSGYIVFDDVTSAPDIYARTYAAGDIVLNSTVTTTGTGNSLIFVADGSFINNVDQNVLSTPNGRWLVYSTSPLSDIKNGLESDFKFYGRTYAAYPESSFASMSGNGFIYSYVPTLTVTAQNTTRSYGATDVNYIITGLIDNDLAADAYSGSAVSTNSTSLNAGSSYALTLGLGSLASAMGYNFAIDNSTAQVTITKADITAVVNNELKWYNHNNPAISAANVTWYGLMNNENYSVLDDVELQYANTATKDAAVGTTHAISIASFNDNNYNLTSFTGGLLTVLPDQTDAVLSSNNAANNSMTNSNTPVTVNTTTQNTSEKIEQDRKTNITACSGVSQGISCEFAM